MIFHNTVLSCLVPLHLTKNHDDPKRLPGRFVAISSCKLQEVTP